MSELSQTNVETNVTAIYHIRHMGSSKRVLEALEKEGEREFWISKNRGGNNEKFVLDDEMK